MSHHPKNHVMHRKRRKRQAVKCGNLAERLLVIGKDCAQRLKGQFRKINHGDVLYDARGLPR